jgi:hypothetical protein
MPEAIYCYDIDCVRFAVKLDGKRTVVQIEEEALRHQFGAKGGADGLIAAYLANAASINDLAVQRLRTQAKAPLVLTARDFKALTPA